jgi:DNA gyrase subunit A
VTGRGGQGITNITFSARTGREVVANFPVRHDDHVMLVTDGGQLIRLEADQVRITGRQAMGVTLMRLSEGERVISCVPIAEEEVEATPGDAAGDAADA